MMGFRFQDPWWLLLLLPLAAAGAAMFWRRPQAVVLYSSVAMLRRLPVTWAQRGKRFLPWLFLAGMAALVLALARPQHGKEEYRIRAEGIAIELAVDRSGSMEALDFTIDNEPADRLKTIKKVIREFVEGDGELLGRPDDLIGLVAFGGFAEAKCPLTFDHPALLTVLDEVKIPQPIRNRQGEIVNARLLGEERATAIGDAIALAVERLKPVKAKSKIIILLTDGESNAGVLEPLEAAKIAKTFGIKIYTIGIGSNKPVRAPAYDMLGRKVITMQLFPLDEPTLKAIAATTGGQYFNARDTASLKEVYAAIDQLEKTVAEGRLYTQYRELFPYAVLPGLGLLLLEIVLISTRFRTLP
jgi:Ca-activated chloride channel family protein